MAGKLALKVRTFHHNFSCLQGVTQGETQLRYRGFSDSITRRQSGARHGQEHKVQKEKPWIIMALRRTGGTSLTRFLSRVSAFPSLEPEPFNKYRMLGGITQAFRDTGDVATRSARRGRGGRRPG